MHADPVAADIRTSRTGWSAQSGAALGRAVRAARKDGLGISQDAMRQFSDVPTGGSLDGLERRGVVHGKDPRRLRSLETIFGWVSGTVEAFRADPGHIPVHVEGWEPGLDWALRRTRPADAAGEVAEEIGPDGRPTSLRAILEGASPEELAEALAMLREGREQHRAS